MNQADDDNSNNKWLLGLECARKLNFTDEQYEEAIKEIKSPDNANQLLDALIDISSRDDVTNTHQRASYHPQNDDKTGFSSTSSSSICNSMQAMRETASSYYSSLASFPSSSDQSLESLQHHHQQHQQLHHQSFPPLKRKIYIDGANVARTHGKNAAFSWTGIMLCVQWFTDRQYQVKVFVAADRCHQADKTMLGHLRELDALVECPSGCNDDMFVIEAARQNNGVIVSNDLYRDEKSYNANDLELKRFIDQNRLPYVFVDDLFIPASDPLGRTGPSLDDFLKVMSEDHHSFAYRTRSVQYQRYPRPNVSSIRQHSHSVNGRRRLHSTRSLPVGQTTEYTNQPQSFDRSSYPQPNFPGNFDQRRPVYRAACGLYKSQYQRE